MHEPSSDNLPYPIAVCYSRIRNERHVSGPRTADELWHYLELLDITLRYAAYTHIARYLQCPKHLPEINAKIEALFRHNSPRAYFTVGQRICQHLKDTGWQVHRSFDTLYRHPAGVDRDEEPAPREAISPEGKVNPGARVLDRIKNLQSVFNLRNDYAHHRRLGNKEAHRLAGEDLWSNVICPILTNDAFTECWMGFERRDGTRVRAMGASSEPWIHDDLGGARVFVTAEKDGTPIHFGDLILLGRHEGLNEVRMLYQASGFLKTDSRRYTSIHFRNGGEGRVGEPADSEEGGLELPWPIVELQRKLPSPVMLGQPSCLELKVVNQGSTTVTVRRLVEHLPDNLRCLTADVVTEEGRACSFPAFQLPPGGMKRFRVDVQGVGVGLGRFANPEIEFEGASRLSVGTLKGVDSVEVEILEKPRVNISRRILCPQSRTELREPLLQDSEGIVSYEVESFGDSPGRRKIIDELRGGIPIDPDWERNLLVEIPRKSVAAKPVLAEYRFRVVGPKNVEISTKEIDGVESTAPPDVSFRVKPTGAPSLDLAWAGIEKLPDGQGRLRFRADLHITNQGSSRAYSIELDAAGDGNGIVRLDRPTPTLRPGESVRAAFEFDLPPEGRETPLLISVSYQHATGAALAPKSIEIHPGRMLLTRENVAALPFIGRSESRKKVREFLAALESPEPNRLVIRGANGTGKRQLLLEEAAGLGDGCLILLCECGSDTSFAEAMSEALTELVCGGRPELAGDDSVFESFLTEHGIPRARFQNYARNLDSLRLLDREACETTWMALAQLIGNWCRAEDGRSLILLLRGIDHFTKDDVEAFKVLARRLAEIPAALVATCNEDTEGAGGEGHRIDLPEFSEGDALQMIDAVFIHPRLEKVASARIIERCEKNPAALKAMLEALVSAPDEFVEFDERQVRVRDISRLDLLPTSISESLLRELESIEVPKGLCAVLASLRHPADLDLLAAAVASCDSEMETKSLRETMRLLSSRGWLAGKSETGWQLRSAMRRDILAAFGGPDLLSSSHSFMAGHWLPRDQNRGRAHLLESTPQCLSEHWREAAEAIGALAMQGCLRRAGTGIGRMRQVPDLPPEGRIKIGLIAAELAPRIGAHGGDGDLRVLRGLLGLLDQGRTSRELGLRLATMEIRAAMERSDLESAISTARAGLRSLPAIQWFPSRRLDRTVVFEFMLAYWESSYRSAHVPEFNKADRWIWSELRGIVRGKTSSLERRLVARFLSRFFALYDQAPEGTQERRKLLPPVTGQIGGREVVVESHPIDVATRLARVQNSFLDQFVRDPDKLGLEDVLLLSKIYDLSAREKWRESGENEVERYEESFPGGPASGWEPSGPVHRQFRYEDWSVRLRAEGAPYELSCLQRTLAETYADLSAAALARGHFERSEHLVKRISRIFQEETLPGFRECGSRSDVASVYRIWIESAIRQADAAKGKDRIALAEPAIGALRAALAEPAIREETQVSAVYANDLLRLLNRTGRIREASELALAIPLASDELRLLRIHLRLEQALEADLPLLPEEAGRSEGDWNFVHRTLRTFRDGEREVTVAELAIDVARLAEELGWRLVLFHGSRGSGGEKSLRILRSILGASSSAHPPARNRPADLAGLLVPLWRANNSRDFDILGDFQRIVLPNLGETSLEEIRDRILLPLAEWEVSRYERSETGRYRNYCASKILCHQLATRLAKSGDMAGALEFTRLGLSLLDGSEANDTASRTHSLRGQLLAQRYRAELSVSDECEFLATMTRIRDDYAAKGTSDGDLSFLVGLASEFLELNEQTRNPLFYECCKTISPYLKEAEGKSSHSVSATASLVRLYLQLPGMVPEATRVLERQCEVLLAERRIEDLPNYLSFLSDLLPAIQAINDRDPIQELMRLISAYEEKNLTRTDGIPSDSEEEAEGEGAAPPLDQSADSVDLTKLCLSLAARVMTAIRESNIEPNLRSTLLYAAAALLEDPEIKDVERAIYLKLFESRLDAAGSVVWAIFLGTQSVSSETFLWDLGERASLCTLSNAKWESPEGAFFWPDPIPATVARNYLISSRTRNQLLENLVEADQDNFALRIASRNVELHRNLAICRILEKLDEILDGTDEINSMQFIRFLHSHCLEEPGEAPRFWQMLDSLRSALPRIRDVVNNLLHELVAEVSPRIPHGADQNPELLLSAIGAETRAILSAQREHGQLVAERLSSRVRDISFEDLIHEIEVFLTDGTRVGRYPP